MPDHHRSEWLVREEFRFFHLYFTPAHLTRIAEEVCDKEGRHLLLEDKTFIDDPKAATLVQGQLMQLDWQHQVDRMALSHGAWMLMLHAYRHHTREAPPLPEVRGGLAPAVIRRVQEYLLAIWPNLSPWPSWRRRRLERIPLRPHVRPEPWLSAPSLPAGAAAQAGQAAAGRRRLPGQHRHPVRLLVPGPPWQPLPEAFGLTPASGAASCHPPVTDKRQIGWQRGGASFLQPAQELPLNHRKRQTRTRHLWFSHWNAPQGRLGMPTPPEPLVPHSSR